MRIGTKLTLILTLTLTLLVMFMNSMVFASSGFDDVDPDKAEVISQDDVKEIKDIKAGETRTFKFTPSKAGKYVFYSMSNNRNRPDTAGRIVTYDAMAEEPEQEIAADDDSGADYHFAVSFEAEAGKVYYLQLCIYDMNKTQTFNVSVVRNTVQAISFVPSKPYEIVEHDDFLGEEDWDADDNLYYRYYIPDFEEGDRLIVTEEDGKKTYTYKHIEDSGYGFVSGDKIISEDYVTASDNQQLQHWEVGADNYFVLSLAGMECKVPVTIQENPVLSISFEPVKPREIVEHDLAKGFWYDGSGESGFFIYNMIDFVDGDKLTVTTKDGTKTYVLQDESLDGDGGFVCGDEVIRTGNINYTDNQLSKKWEYGKENYYTLSYYGKKCNVPVTIIKSPVKSISFTPAEPYDIIENDRLAGTWNTDSSKKTYFHYFMPDFKPGDSFTVTTKDGTDTYTYEKQNGFGVFVGENESINEYDVDRKTAQKEDHWVRDGECSIDFSYLGVHALIPVRICESDVKLISYTPNRPHEYIENDENSGEYYRDVQGNEYFEYTVSLFTEGDEFSVTTDKGTKTYVCEEKDEQLVFICGEEIIPEKEVFAREDQFNVHWVAGSDNYYLVSYKGQDFQVPVSILSKKEKEARDAEEEEALEKEKKDSDELLRQVSLLNESEYTAQSFEAVKDAKEVLESILGKGYATSSKIKRARESLAKAVADLKKAITITVGSTVKIGGSSYVVLAGHTVALKKAKSRKTFKIPSYIKLEDGLKYKVVQVNAKAFTGKKIRTVSIGDNVRTLKKNAFRKSKATKIILKTRKLKKASIRGSLKGSKIKKVKVSLGNRKINKKYIKKYSRLFTKKNTGKKVTVV